MSAIRKIARGVAKNRMKKRGLEKFCKHDHIGSGWQIQYVKSPFARRWKKEVNWHGAGVSKTG